MNNTASERTSKRVKCPRCGYSVRLRRDGSIMGHLLYGAGFGGQPIDCSQARWLDKRERRS